MDRILIIQDDAAVHRILQRIFASSGFEPTSVADAAEALEVFRTAPPHIVILALRLPGQSGPDLCREIRRLSATVPIFVLSSAADEFDKVLLLELGVDDYIARPFNERELLARVRVAIRRANRTSIPIEVFMFDDVLVNFLSMELFRSGKNVPITPQEFKVLRFFVNNQGRVISDSELLNEVWVNRSRPTTGTIKTHIQRLRQKLEKDPSNPQHFRTIHRAGYKFVA